MFFSRRGQRSLHAILIYYFRIPACAMRILRFVAKSGVRVTRNVARVPYKAGLKTPGAGAPRQIRFIKISQRLSSLRIQP